jgi:predicted nuclease with RNAse H fold
MSRELESCNHWSLHSNNEKMTQLNVRQTAVDATLSTPNPQLMKKFRGFDVCFKNKTVLLKQTRNEQG